MSIVKLCRWLDRFASDDVNGGKLYTLNAKIPFTLGLLSAARVKNHEILTMYKLPRISKLNYAYK